VASGYIDWTKHVDIAAQRAAELIARAYKGSTFWVNNVIQVTPNGVKEILLINKRIIILGGSVEVSSAMSQKSDIVDVEIDGERVCLIVWSGANFYNVTDKYNELMYLTIYDDANFDYSMAISPMLTCETSLRITYKENSGNNPFARTRIMYAEI